MRPDFTVFILSHGRAARLVTLRTLKTSNYTGAWYIIIDDTDPDAAEYHRLYPDHVLEFNKREIALRFDLGDNSQELSKSIVYARNVCFDLAADLGYRYFLELDDDYMDFRYQFMSGGDGFHRVVKQADRIFEAMVDFLQTSGAASVCFSQSGDFIGGLYHNLLKRREPMRKAMNTFFCRTDRRFWFVGRINEDINTYTSLGARGQLFMTIPAVRINQKDTQQEPGGMSSLYLEKGTYTKSFYTVMYAPACAKIGVLAGFKNGSAHQRLHTNISWDSAVPKIISERWQRK